MRNNDPNQVWRFALLTVYYFICAVKFCRDFPRLFLLNFIYFRVCRCCCFRLCFMHAQIFPFRLSFFLRVWVRNLSWFVIRGLLISIVFPSPIQIYVYFFRLGVFFSFFPKVDLPWHHCGRLVVGNAYFLCSFDVIERGGVVFPLWFVMGGYGLCLASDL